MPLLDTKALCKRKWTAWPGLVRCPILNQLTIRRGWDHTVENNLILLLHPVEGGRKGQILAKKHLADTHKSHLPLPPPPFSGSKVDFIILCISQHTITIMHLLLSVCYLIPLFHSHSPPHPQSQPFYFVWQESFYFLYMCPYIIYIVLCSCIFNLHV